MPQNKTSFDCQKRYSIVQCWMTTKTSSEYSFDDHKKPMECEIISVRVRINRMQVMIAIKYLDEDLKPLIIIKK